MSDYSTAPSSPLAPPPSPVGGAPIRRSMAEAHVGIGDYEQARCFAYVYLEHTVHCPNLFIRQAMERAAGVPAFTLAASARGAGLMVFNTPEEREEIVALSPIAHDGNRITVEHHEEADNRFYAFYRLYAEIAAVDFPLEHWREALAREALSVLGNVCCLEGYDFTSMRAVVRLDHHLELPDQLLVRNHNGSAYISTVYAVRTWTDNGPEPDWSEYNFNDDPAVHGAPYYQPVGNPPTQLPPAPENLVATVMEWENSVPTPPLRPVHTRVATPYPARAVLALPWYGVGGVPAREELEILEGAAVEEAAMEEGEVLLGVPVHVPLDAGAVVDLEAAGQLAALSLGEHTEPEHESRAQKRRARSKRAKDSARALRSSLRLMEKEEPGFELPEDKATRVQQAKYDFSACGASEEEIARIVGGAELPPSTTE